MKKLAIITYNYYHLKTEQILNNLLIDNIFEIIYFALPFKFIKRRKQRLIFFHIDLIIDPKICLFLLLKNLKLIIA